MLLPTLHLWLWKLWVKSSPPAWESLSSSTKTCILLTPRQAISLSHCLKVSGYEVSPATKLYVRSYMVPSKGKLLLWAPVAVKLLLFVSQVCPHFGVQSIHSPVNPQRVMSSVQGKWKPVGIQLAHTWQRNRSKAEPLKLDVLQLLAAPRGEVQPPSASALSKGDRAMSAPACFCFYLCPVHVRYQRPDPCRPTSCTQTREHLIW